jgi:NCAIR mutase (PurE)-related protein
MPQAVYGPGKTPAQCAGIVAELLAAGASPVILTRAGDAQVEASLLDNPDGVVTPRGGPAPALSTVAWRRRDERPARVLLITAGTADLPVAAECRATLDAFGLRPELRPDCGVAGLHRLLASLDELVEADAVVVVAGMEGALPSLVAGVTPAAVIAVPTSSGYGSSFEGMTALLAMHASCAAGIVVVGIDNGFGAACAVARMLH